MKVAILTGGGDCPGLNAVIRAIVRTLHNEGEGVAVVGAKDGFLGLVADRFIDLDDGAVSGILPRGGTILGTSNRDDPFAFHGEIYGQKYSGQDVSELALGNLRRRGIDALVVIGGDGTQAIAHRFAERGLRVVGVPKTIDNDLAATDRTFGFDTAVGIATEAIDRIHTTAASHHRVMFVEVMGRHAGWIAMHAGIAAGGDVILIPEIPFRFESVAAAIEARRARGKDFSIIVVAEGAAPAGGEQVAYREVLGGAETKRLGGISTVVAAWVEENLGIETRCTILGHVQRGGTPSAFDRILATRFGVCAARAVLAGETAVMASLKCNEVRTVPLTDAVAGLRLVDPEGGPVSAARATGIYFGDE